MKKLGVLFLVISSFYGVAFSQIEYSPKVIKIAIPVYPVPALAMEIEETVQVQLEVDQEGRVYLRKSSTKRSFFNTVIKEALQEWKFEKSHRRSRYVDFKFVFKFLSDDSKSNALSTFIFPNMIEVMVKRRHVIDTPSVDHRDADRRYELERGGELVRRLGQECCEPIGGQ